MPTIPIYPAGDLPTFAPNLRSLPTRPRDSFNTRVEGKIQDRVQTPSTADILMAAAEMHSMGRLKPGSPDGQK